MIGLKKIKKDFEKWGLSWSILDLSYVIKQIILYLEKEEAKKNRKGGKK